MEREGERERGEEIEQDQRIKCPREQMPAPSPRDPRHLSISEYAWRTAALPLTAGTFEAPTRMAGPAGAKAEAEAEMPSATKILRENILSLLPCMW